MKTLLCVVLLFVISAQAGRKGPPHIITIIADDLGWYDVGFHGSNQLYTPNLDALAYNGVILNSHYVQPLCTPSRAAFLTGKYPIHLGMQHSVILEPEPRGLPLGEKLLPEYLKEAGYSTHAVGKWHLGFYKSEYTPTHRGFDTHYGYWNGFQDYFNQSVRATFVPNMIGHDMRRNMDVDFTSRGNYSTHLYTNEAVKLIKEHDDSKPMFLYLAHLAPHTGNVGNAFQAPDEEIAKFSHIKDPERRVYAAMVSALDQSIGEVMTALRQKDMLDNSIVLFFSDNGAPSYGVHANKGSNYPLRGQKNTPWEGSSRGVAAIWSPLLKKQKRVYNEVIHITDWLPTLWSAMGKNPNELGKIDGINIWDALSNNQPSPRKDFVLNIDPISKYVAVRSGKWKYIEAKGTREKYNDWYGEFGHGTQPYNPYDIIMSKTSSSLLGYITDKQILSMHDQTSNFTMTPLSVEDVELLRSEATLKCDLSKNTNSSCILKDSPCLFDIEQDPCETKNLISEHREVMEAIDEMVARYKASSLEPSNVQFDPKADPKLHGMVWVNWLDDDESVSSVFKDFSPASMIAFKIFFGLLILSLAFLICVQLVRECKSSSEPDNKVGSYYKNILLDEERKGCNREIIVNPSVSVAERVVMFEDKEHRFK